MKKENINPQPLGWGNSCCIRENYCVRGLPEVFKPKEKPSITPENSTTEKIIQQVKKCPSGALSYFMNQEEPGITE